MSSITRESTQKWKLTFLLWILTFYIIFFLILKVTHFRDPIQGNKSRLHPTTTVDSSVCFRSFYAHTFSLKAWIIQYLRFCNFGFSHLHYLPINILLTFFSRESTEVSPKTTRRLQSCSSMSTFLPLRSPPLVSCLAVASLLQKCFRKL